MRLKTLIAFLALAFLSPSIPAAHAQKDNARHWVATWATAQQLIPRLSPTPVATRSGAAPPDAPTRSAAVPAPNAPPASASATPASSQPAAQIPAGSSGAPPAAVQPAPQQANRGPLRLPVPPTLSDQTVRMVIRTSIGGSQVRIELSNMANAAPLEVGAAQIGIHKGEGAVAAGTGRPLTFGGKPSFVIPPGVLAISDPVNLDVAPLTDLAISLYLPHDTGAPATHLLGLRTGYIAAGDATAQPTLTGAQKINSYLWLSSVDVAAPSDSFAVVAYGDSITDGFRTTPDAEQAWPALLAKRLSAKKDTQHISVLNEGISGNQVMRDGAGQSALARLDRDILGRPGVKWVVLLEGINDINGRGRTDAPGSLTSDELIGGYRQLIERCHAHGIRVVGATITPEQGVPTASERGEQIRQAVNAWIRTPGNFDAIVDFDKAVQDHDTPARIRAGFDPGDHLHPNDAGNQAMADAFDLAIFRK